MISLVIRAPILNKVEKMNMKKEKEEENHEE